MLGGRLRVAGGVVPVRAEDFAVAREEFLNRCREVTQEEGLVRDEIVTLKRHAKSRIRSLGVVVANVDEDRSPFHVRYTPDLGLTCGPPMG